MIVVTGATGQLGRLVIENLLRTEPASSIIAVVRDPAKATGLSNRGVQVRQADYTQQASLRTALAGADSGASQGGLFDDKHQLSTLIGRPTTPMAETIAAELKA